MDLFLVGVLTTFAIDCSQTLHIATHPELYIESGAAARVIGRNPRPAAVVFYFLLWSATYVALWWFAKPNSWMEFAFAAACLFGAVAEMLTIVSNRELFRRVEGDQK